MEAITAKTPWANQMDQIPMHLDYFEGSMVEKVMQIAEQYPNNIAFDFMGKHTTYRQMVKEIERCARALKTIGIRENDKVTIAMPNCPQAIYMFYAVNLVGAIGNMIHPLSAEKEIEFYLNESESVTAITLDQFYHKFEHIRENTRSSTSSSPRSRTRSPSRSAPATCSPRAARSNGSPRTRRSSAGRSSCISPSTASTTTR